MRKRTVFLTVLAMILTLIVPTAASGAPTPDDVEFTLLHTNDFHGNLETDYKSRGGSAYMAAVIGDIRAEVGAENVALMDAGDVYFAAPAISQLLMGESTIDIYNMLGYDVAVFGNHEFDKGQDVLQERIAQSDFPWLGANVVLEGTDWDLPDWAEPYSLLEVGGITLGVLGLAGEETPEVTLLGTTEGLVFKDLTETILHYYDEVMAEADAMVVLVHMGTDDSGPYDGLVTVAQNLIDAGKPVDLMIGGHQHQALFDPVYVNGTAIVSAGYYGRYLGRVDVSVNPSTKELTVVDYELLTISGMTIESFIGEVDEMYEDGLIKRPRVYRRIVRQLANAQHFLDMGRHRAAANKLRAVAQHIDALNARQLDPDVADDLIEGIEWMLANTDFKVAARIAYWAEIVAPIVNQVIGYTTVDLTRDYNAESIVGDLVTDSMLWKADEYDDGEVNGSVDLAFTNPGGLRADILIPDGAATPHPVTWGDTFSVLPFGNTLYLMDLTGAQIQTLLDQSANLYKGILQTSGGSWYWYNDTGDDSATAWGAYGVTVGGEPLVRDQVYRVVTNNFLAGGQDGWTTFADGTNRWDTYYDMQAGLVEYIGMLDDNTIDASDVPMDRIIRLDDVVTMLHTNDTHGRWSADYYGGGMVYLAELIAEERAHNPDALLLDAGDTFQGNSFAYFFKDRPDNPIAGGMNLLGYDAMVIGNHEFNFGPTTFATMLGQVEFPLLGTANMDDTGAYGFINDNVDDYITMDVGGKKLVIYGLTNPRIYRYELPTNIPGMTFYSAVDTAVAQVPGVISAESPDLMVGLTHVGYRPYGGEVDSDELIAQTMSGFDVLIGGHSHSTLNPAVMVSDPVNNPGGTLVAHARRYAGYLGQVNVGWIGDDIVLREGFLIPTSEAAPDPVLEAYLAPYEAEIDAYNATIIGQTMVPIGGGPATYIEETNSANLQADSAVWEVFDKQGITVDLHLSGAMTDASVATSGPYPADLTKGDMFDLMKYENSLVVFSMNGPEIKTILERSYRNWWYFNQGYPWGGYSHYTTCMLATDAGNVITYTGDLGTEPDGSNVVSMTLEGIPIDFGDPITYYNVSTVNYVAAGSCNFNDAGVTLWPLGQIIADTQLYVRDSVINYVESKLGVPIAPAVDGRLIFP